MDSLQYFMEIEKTFFNISVTFGRKENVLAIQVYLCFN